MKTKGFTLIETLVVVAVLSILALMGVETITAFQKTALLDGTASEFASSLRLAQNKSKAGELIEGETPDDFESDGLPEYGIRITDDTYSLFRDYQLFGDPAPQREILDNFSIEGSLEIGPNGAVVVFPRISGLCSATTFTVQRQDGNGTREVNINDAGVISLTKI